MGNEELTGLINGAKRGETEALERLYAASYNKVYFYAYKIFGNVDDAIDVVQDVFIIVFTKIKTLKEPLSYFNWLSKIVVNRCKEKQRREGKDRDAIIKQEDSELIDNIIDDETSVEGRIEKQDMRKYMLGVIDILPEEQKRAVLLFYYEKLTIAQIAEIEETAEATVKSRLFYARDKIRKALQKEEKRGGIRLFSFGAPAIATLLQQNASLCLMPTNIAQEVFYAVLAIVGMEAMADRNRAVNFVAFNDDERTDSFWKRIKSGIIVEVKPKRAIAILILLLILIGGIVFTPKIIHALNTTSLKVTTVDEGALRINKSDLPAVLREKAKYYGEGFYHYDVDVTAQMAYLRTSKGGFMYGSKEDLNPVKDIFDTSYYNEETEVISFFDKDYNMIAYGSFYTKTKQQKVKHITLNYRLKFDVTSTDEEVSRDVDKAFKGVKVLTPDYFYYRDTSYGIKAMCIKLDKLPKSMRDITNTSNVWTNKKGNLKNLLKGAVAQYWSKGGKFTGDVIFNMDETRKNVICFYHYGEFSTVGNGESMPYNVVAIMSHGKLIAVAYLKDSDVEGSPSAK